ncbi:tRNA endonuclease ANKZF1 [Polymixia lowei]
MTTWKDHRSIFDCCLQDEAVTEVTAIRDHSVHITSSSDGAVVLCAEDDRRREGSLAREVPERMVCSTCRCPFNNREEQTEHYKLDWHRFNLRQKIIGLPPVTVDEFEMKTGTGDMSSISGSDSDSGEDSSDSEWAGKSSDVPSTDIEGSVEADSVPSRRSSKVVFQNSEGQYLAVYRCVLQGKSDDEGDVVASLKTLSNKTLWVILMTGGGHFAGAVFQGKEVLQHKTFHRYTVRAKRGTAQGLRDAQNRSHAPKSAGAALRRYNEAALVKDIQDLMDSWAEHLKEASVIFLRAPSYNKTIFFGSRAALLDKKDPRIRTLPFATRRATFREVQRVHELLSTVRVYGQDTEISTILSPSKKVWKRAPKPTAQSNSDQEKEADEHDSSDEEEEEEGETQLEMVEMTLGTLDLREYEIQPSRQRKRRRRRKKEENKTENEELNTGEVDEQETALEATPTENTLQEKTTTNKRKSKAQSKKKQVEEEVDESWEYGLRDELYTACKIGDVDSLRSLLRLPGETSVGESPEEPGSDASRREQPPGGLSPLALLDKPIDSSGFTLLHVASAAGQKAVVNLLMDAGADPACRDNKGQPPYVAAPDKDTRNVFRKYMGENPDKYDYSKAQIPGPLTAEIESKKMEKKKAQKAAKKQREKEVKEEKKKQEQEAEEKKRFASLTDREKRALAAERRLAEQVAATGADLSNVKRCWLCGESLLGKIPFKYLDYSFCTPRCVQAHRKANAPAAKT